MQYLAYFNHKNKIYVKYVTANGRVGYEEVKDYTPAVFIHSNNPEQVDGYSLYGRPLAKLTKNENLYETKKLIEQYDSSNFPVYGYSKTANSYVYEEFKDQKVDYSLIHTHLLDIETECENGFPDPLVAQERINIIGVRSSRTGKYHLFYLFDEDLDEHFEEDVVLQRCDDEVGLLVAYMNFHTADYPDIISGWNSDYFDIVYMYNRMKKIMSEDFVNKWSPFGFISTREFTDDLGRPGLSVTVKGVALVDFMLIYKKFVKKPRPNYRLETIGKIEVKEGKLKHPSKIPGHLLYRTKEYFVDGLKYNLQDIKLLQKLEEKLKLIYLTQVITYISYTNFDDVNSNMRIIDMLCYMFLRDQNKYFEWSYSAPPAQQYEGAAVKPTIPGKYRWVASFDVTSEYPSLIRAMNISPETLTRLRYTLRPSVIIDQKFDNTEVIAKDVTIAANGTTYRRDKPGFLPDIVRMLFGDRAKYKAMKVEADKAHNKDLANEYDIYQNAMKVLLNSIYGVTGARFFRFYSLDFAEGITLSGQAMIGWIIRDVNKALQKLLGDEVDRVIASDTDSIYVALEDVIIKKFGKDYNDDEALAFMEKFCDVNINGLIEKSIEKFGEYMNCVDRDALDMKREVLADDAIFLAKKRYIMSIRNKEGARYDRYEEIKVTGVEAIKSSTPEFCQEAMMKVFEHLLYDGQDEFHDYVNKFRTEFYNASPSEVADNSGVNGIAKYQDHLGFPMKGTPKQSRAAITHNLAIKELKIDDRYPMIREGDKIRYITLTTPNPLKQPVLGWLYELPDEFGIYRQYFDYDAQFTKIFDEPMHKIAELCGIKRETSTAENPFL